MSSRYWELTVAVSPDASEGLTNFVWELGALGVVEEESAAGRARLRAFFPEAADSDAIASVVVPSSRDPRITSMLVARPATGLRI